MDRHPEAFEGAEHVPPADDAARRRAATRATWCISGLLAVVAALLGFFAHAITPGSLGPVTIPWWGIALGFVGAELAVFHFQIEREGHAFTLSEIPLVAGLFYCSPIGLVLGRTVGAGALLVARERQSPTKLAFNVALFGTETGAALLVFSLVRGDAWVTEPRAWIAALAATLTADLVGVLAVGLVVSLHGGEPPRWKLLVAGTVTAIANTSLAVTGVLLVSIDEIAIVLLVAVSVVLVLAYRGYTALSERFANLELLYDFTKAVGVSMNATAMLDAVLTRTRELMQAESAEIMLLDLGDGDSVFRATTSASGTQSDVGHEPLGTAWLRDAVVTGGSVVRLESGDKDPLRADHLTRSGHKDMIVAPLPGHDGVMGTLSVADRFGDLNTFVSADARLFETLANHAAIALQNGRLIDELRSEVRRREHQALHDGLTGLPNRTYFLERLAEQITDHAEEPCALMILDLNQFKEINDTLGHHSGDLLLAALGERLQARIGDDTFVARLGGDEFGILAPGATDHAAALAIGVEVRRMLMESFMLDGIAIEVGGSIGIAMWPEHGPDPTDLIKCADIAMYEAKATDAGVALHDATREEDGVRRLQLLGALRDAIAHGGLELHFQPQARLRDGAIVGAEALVRWVHADYGWVGPDEFIPLAERAGLIGDLTRVVLREALRCRREWLAHGHDLGVSVNLSARTIHDPHFVRDMVEMLAETETQPSALTIEITESLFADPNRSASFLQRISDAGVRISVDDFGTGFSSLSYLHRFPVDEVKIDKSFVSAMSGERGSDVALCRSIVDLGHNLGLTVVAEGVETSDGWQQLAWIGCDNAQGYLLARPLPADALMEWLDEQDRIRGFGLGSAAAAVR